MNKNQTIKKLTNELNELKGKYSQIQIELGEKSKEIDVLFKMICLKWCFRWFLIKMTQKLIKKIRNFTKNYGKTGFTKYQKVLLGKGL